MKQCLLDTNILSYFLRGDAAIVEKFRAYRQHYSYISFSIFTYYEIKSGLTYRDAQKKMQQFEQLTEVSEVIPFDEAIANTASEVYSNLRNRGLVVAPIDLFIGATALCYDYTVATANIKHFQHIQNLQYENWLE
ncbi:MAG: type II toxin-antitoxin system VapC family toxin [Moorea sp. SIO2I5]|nr:type II toxin-antitoxin system VapC family toxin [Moorena sp. SIO2I5]